MLKRDNTRYKAGVGMVHKTRRRICAGMMLAGVVGAAAGGLVYLHYTPEYAKAEETAAFYKITYMQEMTPDICNSVPTPATNTASNPTTTLRDYRVKNEGEPGYSYTVTKFADGNCWMTDNLALSGGTTLTINDSDLDTSVFTDESKTYTLPAATTGGFSNAQVNDKNDTATYPNQQVRNAANPDTNKYGAYYSWCVATAGTCLQGIYADIIPNSNNIGNAGNIGSTTVVPNNQNATSSICPKGWQLPVVVYGSTPDKSYRKLLNISSSPANSIVIRQAPYNFVYGGIFHNSLYNSGSYGYYWSSTVYEQSSAYNTYINDNGFVIDAINNEYYTGQSVRCVNSDTRYGWELPLGPNQAYGDINVTIPTILTGEAASNIDPNITPNNITNGTITATVSSNTEYNIFLSADQPNLINSKDSEGINIPASINVSPNTNAWAIKNDSTDNTYKAIKTTTDTFYNTKTTDTLGNDIHTYNLGISIAPSLPVGTYSTDVTVTVSTK